MFDIPTVAPQITGSTYKKLWAQARYGGVKYLSHFTMPHVLENFLRNSYIYPLATFVTSAMHRSFPYTHENTL